MEDSCVVLLYAFHAPALDIPASKPPCTYSVSTISSLSFPSSTGFLSYSWLTTSCSVVLDICHFFLLHLHLSFLTCLLPTQLQKWVGLQSIPTLSFGHGSLGIFLICLPKSTGESLNRLSTALGLVLLLRDNIPVINNLHAQQMHH